MLACLFGMGLQAQKTSKISAVAHGYTGRVIDFEFVDDTRHNRQFAYVEGQKMEFEVKLKEPSLMKINVWVWVMVCPGDEIRLDLQYEKKSCHNVTFAGTPSAVALNEAVGKGRISRLKEHYKANPLAAVVTQVPVADYYRDTKRHWEKERRLLEEVRAASEAVAFNYVYAELEGMYLSNLVTYPFIAEEVLRKDISEYLPEDYWRVLDTYRIKDDRASLKSFSYIKWLLDYKEYRERKEAHEAGRAFHPVRGLEEAYQGIVDFYDGAVRDAALYVLLYEAIKAQKDFGLISKLTRDYLKKYNQNKAFKAELMEMQK